MNANSITKLPYFHGRVASFSLISLVGSLDPKFTRLSLDFLYKVKVKKGEKLKVNKLDVRKNSLKDYQEDLFCRLNRKLENEILISEIDLSDNRDNKEILCSLLIQARPTNSTKINYFPQLTEPKTWCENKFKDISRIFPTEYPNLIFQDCDLIYNYDVIRDFCLKNTYESRYTCKVKDSWEYDLVEDDSLELSLFNYTTPIYQVWKNEEEDFEQIDFKDFTNLNYTKLETDFNFSFRISFKFSYFVFIFCFFLNNLF